jgi:hypothetical protein
VVGVAGGDRLPVGGAGGVRLALLLLEHAEVDHRRGGVVGVAGGDRLPVGGAGGVRPARRRGRGERKLGYFLDYVGRLAPQALVGLDP